MSDDATPAVIAQCPKCKGVKAVELEVGNQGAIDRWFDRGDILSKQSLGWFKAQPPCRCEAPRSGGQPAWSEAGT